MQNLLAFGIGTQELIIVVVLILLLFGGTKIPELMRGMGRGVGELQKGLEEGKRSFNASVDESKSAHASRPGAQEMVQPTATAADRSDPGTAV